MSTHRPRTDEAVSDGTDPEALLQVINLKTHVFTKAGIARAVDGVDLVLRRGQTVGLVGESGSGKSMTALSILRLLPKVGARIVDGKVMFHNVDLLQLSENDMRKVRGKKIALVVQDPMTALNPVFSIGNQLAEPLRLHQRLRDSDLSERALELLRFLRIAEPRARLKSYPHHLSGGMRQRVVGAIALSCDPEILIADEPTTALDVTVQAAYLALLKDIQRQLKLSILFITHDFGVVGQMCDRVAVMYAGKVVENAARKRLFEAPAHPYTDALLRSVPDVGVDVSRLATIEGQPPPVTAFPTGCRFHPRCWLYQKLGRPENCRIEEPILRYTSADQGAACHYSSEIAAHRPGVRGPDSRPPPAIVDELPSV